MRNYVCVYCGQRLSEYSALRAEYEGCPCCGRTNTVELRADTEKQKDPKANAHRPGATRHINKKQDQ